MSKPSARKNPRKVVLSSPILPHIDSREKYTFDQAFLPAGALDWMTAFDLDIDYRDYIKSVAKCTAAQRAIWDLYQCTREITNPVLRMHAMTSLMGVCAAFEVESAPAEVPAELVGHVGRPVLRWSKS